MENDELKKNNEENFEEQFSAEQEKSEESFEPIEDLTSEEEFQGESQESIDELAAAQNDPEDTFESIEEVEPEQASIDQSVEEVKESEVPDTSTQTEELPKKKSTWFQKGLIYLIIGLLLLLVGYLIAYFTSTVPKQALYQTKVNELQSKETELETLNNQYKQMEIDYESTQDEFATLETDFQNLNQEHESFVLFSGYNEGMLSLKYEIANARYYLMNEDKISGRQAIILAKEHFTLVQDGMDSDIASGIEDSLVSIQRLINSDPEKAVDELRTLLENLERIQLE